MIPGDGIGPEVISESLSALQVVLSLCDSDLEWTVFPWGSDFYHQTGEMMPPDSIEILSAYDAIFFGAVGHPTVPDHVAVWGLVLPIRKSFQQYVNLRPIKWFEGVPARLSGKVPSDVDMLFVRENVEGEYADLGGRLYRGQDEEAAVQTGVFTRKGIARVARYAFEQAARRRKHVTSITKSNALRYSMVLWDDVLEEIAQQYPDIAFERMHVDAAAYKMVMKPEDFDVIVASNLFGDILTDLGAALQGSLGVAASANLDPSHQHPSMFEPIHGSAPDIAGQGIANPAGAIWAASMMLEHLGLSLAGTLLLDALRRALRSEELTPDLGGSASTFTFAEGIRRQLSVAAKELL